MRDAWAQNCFTVMCAGRDGRHGRELGESVRAKRARHGSRRREAQARQHDRCMRVWPCIPTHKQDEHDRCTCARVYPCTGRHVSGLGKAAKWGLAHSVGCECSGLFAVRCESLSPRLRVRVGVRRDAWARGGVAACRCAVRARSGGRAVLPPRGCGCARVLSSRRVLWETCCAKLRS